MWGSELGESLVSSQPVLSQTGVLSQRLAFCRKGLSQTTFYCTDLSDVRKMDR